MTLGVPEITVLVFIFFMTSIVGVVTGGISLVTVPALLFFGVDPHTAIATNMLALTLLSSGATIPFLREKVIPRRRTPTLIGLTVIGSIIGASLVVIVSQKALPLIISMAMIAIAAFILLHRPVDEASKSEPGRLAVYTGFGLTLLLGVYGGFFSGGYVTILTATCVGVFRMRFIEAVATTKMVNVFKSLVATAIFAYQGIIDWQLGVILGAAMFAGAMTGARIALKIKQATLQRLFVGLVIVLALKILLFDVL